jgi:hypothetical protein
MTGRSLMIKGAAAFGVHLAVEGDDLVYDAKYEVAPGILEKIAAHEEEIVSTLKPRRAAIAALRTEIQDLDSEQYAALRNVKAEEIEILQAALSAMEAAAAIIVPVMKTNRMDWHSAVQFLMNHPGFTRYARHRPKGYSDEQWLCAVYQARDFGLKAPPQKQKVAP